MAGRSYRSSDTMPKLGHVTDLRTQWLVKTDGALAHHLQDREISSHLCENRYRNQQIRQDFPVALSEQQCFEHEAYQKELVRRQQAERDAEIAREIAEINMRQQRRNRASMPYDQPQAHSSRDDPALYHFNIPPQEPPRELKPKYQPEPVIDEIDVEALGLPKNEILEMKKRLEQEERDARLARQLSSEVGDADLLMADMKCAVEAQDNELARLLQEREYRKLQRAKEKARQKALLKKQQKLAAQQEVALSEATEPQPSTQLLDAYSNPRDMLKGPRPSNWASKSVDSDLNYVEPFEKEHIQSKANAMQNKEMSRQLYAESISKPERGPYQPYPSNRHSYDGSEDPRYAAIPEPYSYKQPPPIPTGKKPRFPEPSSIRPAAHYSSDNILALQDSMPAQVHSTSLNSSSLHSNGSLGSPQAANGDIVDGFKRFSVASDEGKKGKDLKKHKGCKIQ